MKDAHPSQPTPISRSFTAAAILAALAAGGCGGYVGSSASPTKSLEVAVRVPPPKGAPKPLRSRFVLVAVDGVQNRNLSQTPEYRLREKSGLAGVLLKAAVPRMKTAGIEPLQEDETGIADGRLVFTLMRLETQLKNNVWFAIADLKLELFTKDGRLMGKAERRGSGAHQDSRVRAGAAGVAMGKALAQALDRLPWEQIASSRLPLPKVLPRRRKKRRR